MFSGNWQRGLGIGVLVLVLMTGCQSKSATTSGSVKAAGADSAKEAVGPTTFPGKWAFVITGPEAEQATQPSFRDVHLMLLEFKDGQDGLKAEVHATLKKEDKFAIENVKVDADQITFELLANDQKLEYQGLLKDGIVRGTLSREGAGATPVILRPTAETAYDPQKWDPTPPTPGGEMLIKSFSEKSQPSAIITAATELRGSPLALEAFGSVFARLGAYPPADDQSIRTLAALFLDSAKLWGPRMAHQVRATVILNTAASRKYPRVALEWLEDAETKLGDSYKTYEEALQLSRDQVVLDIALMEIRADDAEIAKAAYGTLDEKLKLQRYNPELLHALAIYANGHDMADKAIEYWSDIVALPLLEGMWMRMQQGKPPGDGTPHELLVKLWEAKHGNLEGYDKFLEETYNRRIAELTESVRKAGPAKPELESPRTVLVELFTGAMCGPCVAGDLALDLVSDEYPGPKVIALRYHQHIPGPDPLANLDAEDRFGYYEGSGTPLMVVDGAPVAPPGVGGMLQHLGQSYGVLRKSVDARLQTPSDVQLTVSAALENGEVVVNASATGWPEDKTKRLRLRLALVENQVPYPAPNGIRVHEHLVRTMIGGAKGTAVKSGQLAITTKVALADLKQTLSEYLTQFEKNRSVEFPIKPLALDGLSVVAWVQNDENREVLQTVIMPVTGSASTSATGTDAPASASAPENAAKD